MGKTAKIIGALLLILIAMDASAQVQVNKQLPNGSYMCIVPNCGPGNTFTTATSLLAWCQGNGRTNASIVYQPLWGSNIYSCDDNGNHIGWFSLTSQTCPTATPAYTFIPTSGMCERPAKSCPANMTGKPPVCVCKPDFLPDPSGAAGCVPKKVVVIDPGHGLTCPSIKQAAGAIGVTDFPPSNPPPGKLREDELTLAIALEAERLLSKKYKVVLTKRDVISCPSFEKRGQIANDARAKVFVSIHINAPNTIIGIVNNLFGNGTSVIYNSEKPASKGLADQMSLAVSSNLGTTNRGSMVDDSLAVLKPKVTKMTAVLVEVARLSGTDEEILHTSGSVTRAAMGIQSAVQAYVGD